jgi:hypothetical protein
MDRNAAEGESDLIGKTMKAVKILIVIFEVIGLTILGSMFYTFCN